MQFFFAFFHTRSSPRKAGCGVFVDVEAVCDESTTRCTATSEVLWGMRTMNILLCMRIVEQFLPSGGLCCE